MLLFVTAEKEEPEEGNEEAVCTDKAQSVLRIVTEMVEVP